MSQCQVCGCNESRACLDQAGRQCAWIDTQENLCSRCALQIFGAAFGAADEYRTALDELRWLDKMVRVQRWLLRQLIDRVTEHDRVLQLIEQEAASMEPPESGTIWTPGHF